MLTKQLNEMINSRHPHVVDKELEYANKPASMDFTLALIFEQITQVILIKFVI